MASKNIVPKWKLNNGYEIPAFGLGTYKADAYDAVKCAIDNGYRHIDTAFFYGTEEQIGKAVREKIQEGVVERKDIFVTSKLWPTFHSPERVVKACKRSVDLLGLEYIDLFLIHWPFALKYVDEQNFIPKRADGSWETTEEDYVEVWKKMEECVELGYVRSIGLSNFNSAQIKRVLEVAKIKPVMNQVECSLQINQKPLTEFCKQHGILVSGYCPLGRPDPVHKKPAFLFDEDVLGIAQKYWKSPAQVALRYLIQIGVIPLPKSSNPKRILENVNIFDFELSADDMKILSQFNTGERCVTFSEVQDHPYYPFHHEF